MLRASLITRGKLPSPEGKDRALAVATHKDQAPVAVAHVQHHQRRHQMMNGVKGLLH